MSRLNFGYFLVVALICCALSGCRSAFHLVLYNDTDDIVILRDRGDLDRTPVVIYAELAGDMTGVSTDDFTIERKGKTLHYRFPPTYTYPSSSALAKYERKVESVGRSFCFQLVDDNRIFILRRHEAFNADSHLPQPPGFPLVPR